MWIARAHHLAAVFEYLYVSNKFFPTQIEILIYPFINNELDVIRSHARQRQAVVWRKAKHPTDAAFALSDDQITLIHVTGWRIRLKCRKIVVENESVLVIRVSMATCPLIAWTQITFWIVARGDLAVGLFLLALPGALCAVRRDNEPFAR
jgi:hypothetical protein